MALTFCRGCSAAGLSPLLIDRDGQQWYACACGSHSCDADYDPAVYGDDYYARTIRHPWGVRLDAMSGPAEWFGQPPDGDRSFLDVGCLDEAMMRQMEARGWSPVAGFDCFPSDRLGGCVVIHPFFRASLFPGRFAAVFAGDVLEHVPGWRQFVQELALATRPGGVLQITTPKPCGDRGHEYTPYVRGHLQLISPVVLRQELVRAGLAVIVDREPELGYSLLCRKAP